LVGGKLDTVAIVEMASVDVLEKVVEGAVVEEEAEV
jgi:hypothetical protein